MNDRDLNERSIRASTYDVIGVYRITPTMESILDAARYHGYDFLIDTNGNYKDQIYWDNHINLALIELQILGGFNEADLMKVGQNDQAVFMEFYLSPEGKELLTKEKAEQTDGRRVCFFLHFVDTSTSLMIKEKAYRMPGFSKLPDRLVPFTHYLPVD